MSILKTILVCFGIAAMLTTIVYAEKIHAPETSSVVEVLKEPLTPIQLADKYAMQYGVDANILKKVMQCESGGNVNVKPGDGGRANGVMQFHEPTFYGYAKKLGVNMDYGSYEDQIHLAAYMISIGEGRQWTTYRALMNGGSYTFFYKLENRYITVYCK